MILGDMDQTVGGEFHAALDALIPQKVSFTSDDARSSDVEDTAGETEIGLCDGDIPQGRGDVSGDSRGEGRSGDRGIPLERIAELEAEIRLVFG
jgi:hypothetical protein